MADRFSEALIERLEKSHAYHARNSREEVLLYRDIRIINEQLAADVVEVVRCKDCKQNPQYETKHKGMVWCRRWRSETNATGFCSYGERRNDA